MPQRDQLEEELIDFNLQSWQIAEAINRFDELVDDGVDPNDAYGIVIADYE